MRSITKCHENKIINDSNSIKEFLAAFDLPAIGFTHDITFSDGYAVTLGSEFRIAESYYSKKLPFVLTNNNGRILQEGLYLSKYIIEPIQQLDILIGHMRSHMLFKNALFIANHLGGNQNLFSFYFDCDEAYFMHHVMNFSEKYRTFIKKYLYKFREQINDEVEHYKSKFPILEINSDTIFLPILQENPRDLHTQGHHELKNLLSPQQLICLAYVHKGMSAKEIAKKMNLSYRTVEYYLSIIKSKLGARNLKELIAVSALYSQ